MRFIYTLIVSIFPLVSCICTATTNVDAATGPVKVGFVKEMAITGSKKLVGWDADHLFVVKQDNTIDEIDLDGHLILSLSAKDGKGVSIFKQPEAVAVSDGLIYIVDSGSNLVALFSRDGKFQGNFGAKRGGFFGSKAGVELSSPQGVATFEGIVYVSDTGNSKIQMFGINGVHIDTLEIDNSAENKAIKEKGSPFKLREPTEIAIDGRGDIYVLDTGDNLIKIYSPNGKYLRHLPKDGQPLTFCLSKEGVYVADKDSLVIRRYDFEGKLNYSFGARGEGRGLFKSINGLVTGKDLQVYLNDGKTGVVNYFQAELHPSQDVIPKLASRISIKANDALSVSVSKLAWNNVDTIYGIDADKKSIVRIMNGQPAGVVDTVGLLPVGLAVDKDGVLWVLDKIGYRVVKLDESGAITNSIGSKGSKKGQLSDPTDIAISHNGQIYIADQGNNWIQIFNRDGGFVRAITKGKDSKIDTPVSISISPQDRLFVLDKGRSVVMSFSDKGEPLNEFGKAHGIFSGLLKPVGLMATQDEVFVLDSNQVKVFSHQGHYQRTFAVKGDALGEIDDPVAITAKDSTSFFISERGNKRIQTFTTLYKPGVAEKLNAQGGVHAIELQWTASSLPYVKQYNVYRSKSADTGFVKIASSLSNQYTDVSLVGGEQNFYRIVAETHFGYEGETSVAVYGIAQKFTPPVPENVQAEATPWQLKLSWRPVEKQYLAGYLIYQKEGDLFTKLGEVMEPEFTLPGLKPDTKYTLYVATRSRDNLESEKLAISASTLPFNKAPLEIDVLKMRDIFSNTYKLYEEDGVGRIKLTNNTDKPIENVKVSFTLKNVMDFPTEIKISQLLPGKSEEIMLKAVFNNSILTISEDSSVQALIEASFYENGAQVIYSKSSTVKVYDKHRLTWDERGRYAAFITPKDPPIMNFVRSVATQFQDAKDEAQLAAVIFEAMGVAGLTYLPDPANPYQVSSGKTDVVDYIQYPRETLRRKSGDCDDLVAIYSAALESLGIYTLAVEVPGHMFMMFSTGIDADNDGYTNNDLYVIHKGKLWIPVETTVIGKSFVKAWELGAANYYKWKDKGLTLLDVHESWISFKPATLPESTQAPLDISAKQMEKKFAGDLVSVIKISSQTKIRAYQQAIISNPADMNAHLQAGIILAKLGDRSEASKYFDIIIKTEPQNAAALNNRGNIFMIEENFPAALKSYIAATQYSPEDADLWVNLAKSYKAQKNVKKAKESFVKAQKVDITIKSKHKALAQELLNTL